MINLTTELTHLLRLMGGWVGNRLCKSLMYSKSAMYSKSLMYSKSPMYSKYPNYSPAATSPCPT
jgi:hypothetical protein